MTETAEKPNTPFSEQQEALTQQLYERKCDKPSPEDILNALYELELPLPLERRTLAKRIYESWASNVGIGVAIRSTWFGSDAEFGAFIRAWFKKDFLEVSDIEAQEEMADNACPESVGAGETT